MSSPEERIPDFVAEKVMEDARLRRFDEGACNPWHCIEAFDAAVEDGEKLARNDAAGPRSAFDPGIIRRPGITLRTMPVATADRYGARLSDHIGIPMAMKERVNVMQSRMARAIGIFADVDRIGSARVLVAATRGDKDLLEQRFNRIAVARLDQAVVRELFARIRRALDYPLTLESLDGYWVARSGHHVELMSRMVIRLSSDDARSCFRFALDLARHSNWRHPALFDSLSNLIGRSLDAMAPADRAETTFDLISFPLPSEVGAHVDMGWPEPIDHILAGTERPWHDIRWSDKIVQLAAAVEHGEEVDASRSILRLLQLARNGMLSADERLSFGRAFWSRRTRLGDPGVAWDIAFYAVFETPAPDEGERRSILRRLILGTAAEPMRPSTGSMWLLRRMAELKPIDGVRDYLSDDELMDVFDALVAWRMPKAANGFPELVGARTIQVRLGHDIAAAMTHAVLPALSAERLRGPRLTVLRDLMLEPPLSDYLILVPEALRLGALDVDEATSRLQEALLSPERRTVAAALWSVGAWAARHPSEDAPPLPRQLVEEVAGLVALRVPRALPQALQTAGTLVTNRAVTRPDIQRLAIGLGRLLEETDYAGWAGNDEEAARLTLVRADAVRLSCVLARHGYASDATARWIGAAEIDALPEVRFATR